MTKLPLAFHPDARQDALEAYQWYFKRSSQAAEAFEEKGRVVRIPQSCPAVPSASN